MIETCIILSKMQIEVMEKMTAAAVALLCLSNIDITEENIKEVFEDMIKTGFESGLVKEVSENIKENIIKPVKEKSGI